MSKTHSLIFKNSAGKTSEISKIEDFDKSGNPKSDSEIISDAMLLIRAFCVARSFKIFYTRIWNRNGKTVFDVGSHTEFFHLIPEVDINT